jgi:hypothetical protein
VGRAAERRDLMTIPYILGAPVSLQLTWAGGAATEYLTLTAVSLCATLTFLVVRAQVRKLKHGALARNGNRKPVPRTAV